MKPMVPASRKTTYIFLVLLVVAVLIPTLGLLTPFLKPLAFAVIIGVGFYPLHERLRKHIRKPALAALTSTLILIFAVLVPALVLASLAGSDLIRIADNIRDHTTQSGGAMAYLQELQESVLSWAGRYVDVEATGIAQRLKELPAQLAPFFLNLGKALAGNLASFSAQAILTLLILFFILRDGPGWLEMIASALPLKKEQTQRLFTTIQTSIVANLYGILGVAAAQGLLTGIGAFLAGINSAPLLAMVAAISSVVPLVGTSVVWVPAGIYLLAAHHTARGIFLLAWGLIIVTPSDNIIRPLVLFGRVQLHPLLIVFGIIGGVIRFGFVGLFLGPMLISLLVAVIDTLRQEVAEEHAQVAAGATHIT